MYEEKKQYTLDDNIRSMTFTLRKIAELLERLVEQMGSAR